MLFLPNMYIYFNQLIDKFGDYLITSFFYQLLLLFFSLFNVLIYLVRPPHHTAHHATPIHTTHRLTYFLIVTHHLTH